jgi:hypothetical protein
VRALAELPATSLDQVAAKVDALVRIMKDRDGFGDDTGEKMALSIRADLDRLPRCSS